MDIRKILVTVCEVAVVVVTAVLAIDKVVPKEIEKK